MKVSEFPQELSHLTESVGKADERIRQVFRDLENLDERFVGKKILFEKFEEINKAITDNRKSIISLDSSTQSLTSYLHKYLPIKMHRTLTHLLDYVLGAKEQRKRLQWFDQIKMPLLTMSFLRKEQCGSLSKEIKDLDQLIFQQRTVTSKEMVKGISEEKIIKAALSNTVMHERARMLIKFMTDEKNTKQIE